MSRIRLSLAAVTNARTRPVLEGAVEVEGVDVVATAFDNPGELFLRQLRSGEFDVSEMSLASLLITIARGGHDWVAVPVFPQRRMFHTKILVRADSAIIQPADLRGARFGINEYQNTASVWTRGVLEDEFGVAPTEVTWYSGRPRELSHGGETGFAPPSSVTVQQVPSGSDLATLLLDGELDAVMKLGGGTLMNPGLTERQLVADSRVRRLFPDVVAEGRRYHEKTGIHPINHVMVVRRSLVEDVRDLPVRLLDAFRRAHRLARHALEQDLEIYAAIGAGWVTDARVLPYGVEANRQVLETLASYVHRHGLTSRQVQLEEVFHPSTLDT